MKKNKKKLPSEQLFYSARAYLNFSLEEKELFSLMFSKNNHDIKKLIEYYIFTIS